MWLQSVEDRLSTQLEELSSHHQPTHNPLRQITTSPSQPIALNDNISTSVKQFLISPLHSAISKVNSYFHDYFEQQLIKQEKQKQLDKASLLIIDVIDGVINEDTIKLLDELNYTEFLEIEQVIAINKAKAEYIAQQNEALNLKKRRQQQEAEEKLYLRNLSGLGIDHSDRRLQIYKKYPFLMDGGQHTANPSQNLSHNDDTTLHISHDPDYHEYNNNFQTNPTPKKIGSVDPQLLNELSDEELLALFFDGSLPIDSTPRNQPSPPLLSSEEVVYVNKLPVQTSHSHNDFLFDPVQNDLDHFYDYDQRGNPISPIVDYPFSRSEREEEIVKSFFQPFPEPDTSNGQSFVVISLDDDEMAIINKQTDSGTNNGIDWTDEDEVDLLGTYIEYNKEIQLSKRIKSDKRDKESALYERRKLSKKQKKTQADAFATGLVASKSYKDSLHDSSPEHEIYEDEDGTIYDLQFFDDVPDGDNYSFNTFRPSSRDPKTKTQSSDRIFKSSTFDADRERSLQQTVFSNRRQRQ